MEKMQILNPEENTHGIKHNSIYLDGCFDLCHCGHFNAIRQAGLLGKRLVVGVNADGDILVQKGPPILNVDERCTIVESCKWVKEVVKDAPYEPSIEILDKLDCQYWVHGDDPCVTVDGVDLIKLLNDEGRFKYIKRTTGVSTTDITSRLLKLVVKNQPTSVQGPPV